MPVAEHIIVAEFPPLIFAAEVTAILFPLVGILVALQETGAKSLAVLRMNVL